MSTPEWLAQTDAEMLESLTWTARLGVLALTLGRVFGAQRKRRIQAMRINARSTNAAAGAFVVDRS